MCNIQLTSRLGIHELNSKRQRIVDGYVFERRPQISSPPLQSSSTNALLAARPIKSIHRAQSSQKLRFEGTKVEKNTSSKETQHDVASRINDVGDSEARKASAHVRRFHMSRTTSNGDATRDSGIRKDSPIIFIERRSQLGQDKFYSTEPLASPIPPETTRAQKKPGKNARATIPPLTISSEAAARPAQSNNIPEAFKHRWNVPSEQLAKEMEAYALQEIGLRLAQQEHPTKADRPPTVTHGQGHSKFKPRTEIKRYAERHPDPNVIGDGAMIVDNRTGDEENVNENEYVTEIYVRVPIEDIEASVINAGLLILDSQPDIDAFYGPDDESDEDDEFDDEDENGGSIGNSL